MTALHFTKAAIDAMPPLNIGRHITRKDQILAEVQRKLVSARVLLETMEAKG